MESRYGESKKGSGIPTSSQYSDPFDGDYWIDEKIEIKDDNLVRILVQVYSDESKSKLEAQMETYLLWDSY